MSLDVSDIEFGPSVITYKFAPGSALPKPGEIIKDDKCEMVVTESDESTGTIKLMLIRTDSIMNNLNAYLELLHISIEEVAELIYSGMSSGMTSLIGWESLPDEEREKYRKMSVGILKVLNTNKVLLLNLDESFLDPYEEE